MDTEQLERIRQKAYAIVEANPGGPHADQARRILGKLPKRTVGRDMNKSLALGSSAGGREVSGELSGGDLGSELPPTSDEMAGLESHVARPGLGTRAAATVGYAPSRREFLRGADDMVTFGAGQKLARKAGELVGDTSMSEEQGKADVRESPNARGYGRLAGSFSPGGATATVGRGALKLASPIMNAGRGFLGKAASGTIGGAVANEFAMPVIAGGQAAVRGENPLPIMKEEALNPVNAAAGALLGLAGGSARGIRETGQTGRDIRLVEQYGAKASPFGPKGGVYDSPLFQHMEGTAMEQGQLSKQAAERVLNTMDDEAAALSRKYVTDKAAARDQGQLEGMIDTGAVRQDAESLIAGTGLTTGERAAIRREVIDELDQYPGGMTVDQFNDFRQKLGRIFGVGPGETAVPALDKLRQAAKRTVDETEMGPINEAYSKGLERRTRQHEQLGIAEGGRRDVQERRLANIIQRRANDEAPGTGIQEAGDLGTGQFLAENPQHGPMFDSARLLAAKERMTAGVEPQAGFFRRFSKHGLLEKNLEPAAVAAYRLGGLLGTQGVPASVIAQYLLQGGQR